ncbi:MAG: hypothetical protein HYV77_04330 [Candidatus Wildermuthbacteria bacterium]|nr:hypothetical protein [Candidatus Wildermuthbacteria bacterium]
MKNLESGSGLGESGKGQELERDPIEISGLDPRFEEWLNSLPRLNEKEEEKAGMLIVEEQGSSQVALGIKREKSDVRKFLPNLLKRILVKDESGYIDIPPQNEHLIDMLLEENLEGVDEETESARERYQAIVEAVSNGNLPAVNRVLDLYLTALIKKGEKLSSGLPRKESWSDRRPAEYRGVESELARLSNEAKRVSYMKELFSNRLGSNFKDYIPELPGRTHEEKMAYLRSLKPEEKKRWYATANREAWDKILRLEPVSVEQLPDWPVYPSDMPSALIGLEVKRRLIDKERKGIEEREIGTK